MVLHRVNEKFKSVFVIYGLWITIIWTFSKEFTVIIIVYDAQIFRNDMASRTIFEWGIVTRNRRRFRMLKSCNKTFIVKDFVCNRLSIGI